MGAASANINMGICFLANQLFYAIVKEPSGEGRDAPRYIQRIGSVDFSFNVEKAIRHQTQNHYPNIKASLEQLRDQYHINNIRILIRPTHECWTTLPKLVYDKSDEREDHLATLMKGIPRKDIEPYWFSLSNQDFKFLVARNKALLNGYHDLASIFNQSEFVSDFELGQKWESYSHARGSYMIVSSYRQAMSISSFVLGKLRSATYFTFDDLNDLPYHWLQHSQHLSWMNGLHETIYVFGWQSYNIIDTLKPFWDESADITLMDSLDKMQVRADESTYGFALENAFPAIMLSL